MQDALEQALVYVRGQLAQSSPFDPLLEQWMRMHRDASDTNIGASQGHRIYDRTFFETLRIYDRIFFSQEAMEVSFSTLADGWKTYAHSEMPARTTARLLSDCSSRQKVGLVLSYEKWTATTTELW